MPLKHGDIVLVNYTIWALEGDRERLVDTTVEEVAEKHGVKEEGRLYRPLVVIVGKSRLIPAVEKALKEMDVGEKKVVVAEPGEAYGERSEELVVRIPKKVFVERGITPTVGAEIELSGRRGTITRVTQRFVYIDFNHPLAGKRLKIELEVVRKLEKPEEKLAYLASRWFGVGEDEVKVEFSDGEAKVVLPERVVALRDLEAHIARFLDEVALYAQEARKLLLAVEVDLSRPEEEGGEGEAGKSEEAGGEAGEAGQPSQ